MAFNHKAIAVTFLLQNGKIDNSQYDTIKLSNNLKASVSVIYQGGPSQTVATVTVYGMTLSHMNRFSLIGVRPGEQRTNQILVEAGDTNSGMATVFSGYITDAYIDFAGMPEVSLVVQAHAGGIQAIKPVPPSSYAGYADVATIMAGIAGQMSANFENNGINQKLANPYFPGTAWDQAKACADAAGIQWGLVEGNVLAIWPKNGFRGDTAIVISPETGLIGYPTFYPVGIECTCIYNPSISLGCKVQVQSSIPNASGLWYVHTHQCYLQSETPGGQWTTHFSAIPPGFNAAPAPT